MKPTLLIVGHPHYESSIATKKIVEDFVKNVEMTGEMQHLEIRNLINLYPDYNINKIPEQEALIRAQNIILQFPFYWYNVPAILKLWMDEVLEYGFAYGKTGDKMKNKNLVLSFSTGGPKEAYSTTGRNNYEIIDLLKPFIQTSNLMGTRFLTPVTSHGNMYIPGVYNSKEEIEEKALHHAVQLFNLINSI